MAAYEVLLLNTAIPQIQAAQSGDTYVVPRDIAINATAIISANSATDALRITQTGAGNALVVEDSANPDSTPFVVTATGAVGIGTSSPGAKLDIVTSSTIAGVRVNNATAGKSAMVIQNNGSTVGVIGLTGYWNGDSDTNFGLYAETGSDIRFSTNGVATPKAIIDTSGNLGLGVTPSVNSGRLQVQGENATTSYAGVPTASLLDGNANGEYSILRFATSSDGSLASIAARASTGGAYPSTVGALEFAVQNGASSTLAMTLDASGNLKLGGTADRATTAGTNHLDIFNGTAPVGTLANGISIYSAAGEAYVMDAAGNATLFSPHDAETNEWIFKSKHTPTGKVLKIDVERLLKFVNDHFGLDAVHEFVEE